MGMLNTQDIMDKMFKEVAAISTLNGASYLTSTGRIWKGSIRPDGKENPLLTLKGSRTITNETKLEEWDLNITAFADRKKNGTADGRRLANITGETINRLDASTITITSGKMMQVYMLNDTGVLEDAANPKENFQQVKFRLWCIKSP